MPSFAYGGHRHAAAPPRARRRPLRGRPTPVESREDTWPLVTGWGHGASIVCGRQRPGSGTRLGHLGRVPLSANTRSLVPLSPRAPCLLGLSSAVPPASPPAPANPRAPRVLRAPLSQWQREAGWGPVPAWLCVQGVGVGVRQVCTEDGGPAHADLEALKTLKQEAGACGSEGQVPRGRGCLSGPSEWHGLWGSWRGSRVSRPRRVGTGGRRNGFSDGDPRLLVLLSCVCYF